MWYYVCGEYGYFNKWVYYYVIVFGLDVGEVVLDLIVGIWKYGFIMMSEFYFNWVVYMVNYVIKKMLLELYLVG